jgi:hypothetical protein
MYNMPTAKSIRQCGSDAMDGGGGRFSYLIADFSFRVDRYRILSLMDGNHAHSQLALARAGPRWSSYSDSNQLVAIACRVVSMSEFPRLLHSTPGYR